MISADGFGADATPWRAVQRAAWSALKKEDAAPADEQRACVDRGQTKSRLGGYAGSARTKPKCGSDAA
jgi:hypothetical protein